MQVSPSRRLRLIVPNRDGARALTIGDDLPHADVVLIDGESTPAAAVRWLTEVGLHPWTVDYVVDQIDQAELGERLRETMVVVEAPPLEWVAPPGWGWRVWDEIHPQVAEGIEGVVDQRLAEHAGLQSVPADRSAWARPGWFEAARDWIARELADAGLGPVTSILPVRLWGISAVMRVDTAAGRCFFKAVAPVFGAEPAITVALGRCSQGATPSVIAVDNDQGWLLLDDVGETEVSNEADTRAAIELLVSLQRRLVDHRIELELAGCRHRPLSGLVDSVAQAIDSPVTRSVTAVDASTKARILDGVAESVAAIEGWGLPETFAHGDFHPGNVAANDDGLVIFDWSDACFTTPVVDAVTWTWWYTNDPEREEFVWSCFESAWQREFGIDPAVVDRRIVQNVAAAFHLSSYVDICESIEPTSRVEHAEGLSYFMAMLERSSP